MKAKAFLAASAAGLLAAGCSAVGGMFSDRAPEEFTVHVEPGADTSDDADADAHQRCAAYGKRAVFVDETIDPAGRLRHRHYVCE